MGVNAENVKGWLRSKKICVLEEWVQACVEWIHQEHNGPSMSGSQLCKMVYDQWLDSDLSEIATPCLPAAIKQAKSTKLNGSFALQVNSIQDISSPAYGQLVKLQGKENENALVTATQPTQSKFEPKPSRLLMLTLTDGQQTIQAMEYRPVSCLRSELPPGTKVLLSGDMRCRLGVILLTSAHVKILGGEVEALKEANNQETLLARAIGVTPPDRPVGGQNQNQDQDQGVDQVPQPTTNGTSASSGNNNVATNPTGRSNISNNVAPTSRNQATTNGNRNRQSWTNSTHNKPKQEVKAGSTDQRSWGQGGQRPVVDEFPDELDGIDEQMLEELEMIERRQGKQVKKEAPVKKTEDVVWGEEDFDEEELLLAMEWENSVQPTNRPSTNATSKPQDLDRNNHVRPSSNSNTLQSSCRQQSSDNAFKPQGHSNSYTVPQQQGHRRDDTLSKQQGLSRGCTALKQQGSGRLSASGIRPQTNVSTGATNFKREQNMSASAKNSDRTQPNVATVAVGVKKEPESQGNTRWLKPQPKTTSSLSNSSLVGNKACEKTLPKATAFATNAVPIFRTNKEGSTPLQSHPKVEPMMNAQHVATGANSLVGTTENGSNSDMIDGGSHKMGGSFGSKDRAPNKLAAGSRMAVATRFIKDEPRSQQTSSLSSMGSDPKRRKVERASSLPRPFVYLIHKADQLKRKEDCRFDIKGFIMTLVSSLSHNPTWSLTAKINDGTMSLDVDISEQVLTQLIGFTVKEMMKMKADMKHSDQETAVQIKNHIKQGISQCQQALMEFSCIMTLEMKPGYGRPRMTAFRQATMDDVKMLRDIVNAHS